MSIARIALRLAELSREEKIEFVTAVISALGSHATVFPEPVPTVPELTTAKNNLASRNTTITTLEANLESEKSAASAEEETLDGLITRLASYVENVANGDASIIQLSTYELAQEPTPIGPLPPPENLQTVTADLEGEIKLKWKRVRGAGSYILECASNANGPWSQVEVTTRASATATGLTGGTKYWFRVRAIGTAGPSGWSAPVVKMAA